MERPKPEPLPFGLVEKNGSEARFSVSASIPTPVSTTDRMNVGTRSQFVGQMKLVGFSGLDHKPPPSGMASLAFRPRLRSASSS